MTAFDEKNPSASARERRWTQASLCLEVLARADYESEEVTQLAEKIRNGLGCWLTFITEPDVGSTNYRAEWALREKVVMRKVFDIESLAVLDVHISTQWKHDMKTGPQVVSVLADDLLSVLADEVSHN